MANYEEDDVILSHVQPVRGYYELLEEIKEHPEFPIQMYIPLYYDVFKVHHGWEYAELLQATIFEGQSHDETHEIWWYQHPNEAEEDGIGSALSKAGSSMARGFSKAGSAMASGAKYMGSSLASGASKMYQAMPSMQTMMETGQNLYGLGQMGYQTYCQFQPQNPQCQGSSITGQILGQGSIPSMLITP